MEWINIENKRPKFGERVLTAHNGNGGFKRCIFIQIASLREIKEDSGGRTYSWYMECNDKTVTNINYWMPLPSPPNN